MKSTRKKKIIPSLPELTCRTDRLKFIRRYLAFPSWNPSAILGLSCLFVECETYSTQNYLKDLEEFF